MARLALFCERQIVKERWPGGADLAIGFALSAHF